MPNINLSKKNISLDLQHIGYTNTIYAQQDDIDSRQLAIRLFDNGKAFIIPDNATVSLCGTRADKTIIYRDVDSFDGNEITITFKNEELAASGIAKYKIEIKTVSTDGAEKLLTSVPFKLKIYQNIYDENGKLAAPQYSDLKRELDSIHSQEEALRIAEESREKRSSIAIANTEQAAADAISAVNDLQNKIVSHHFVLTEDKDTAGGVAGLDTNSKVSNSRLNEASVTTKGITQLDDSVSSNSSSRAATSKAVKTAYDKAASVNEDLQTHNSSSTAHDDMRNLISDLTTRLNALADSDDTTLDQLSEIVAYIKNNKSLIDNVTTNKVNVSDIINSLTSTAANKPLSAKQGKVLHDLITELTDTMENKIDKISGKGLSTNDYTSAEKSKLAGIASGAEVNVQSAWNETDTSSDAYIKNKPTIPAAVRVKGSSESTYRVGDVNITAQNVGALPTGGGEVTGDVIFDKYVGIKAWPNYGEGTARAWYNANTKTIDFDGGVLNIDLNATSAANADTVDGKHASELLNYNNLTNKPTIPSVGNGTVTIKQAGTQKGTFTMNQSGNTTIELADNNTTYGIVSKAANGLAPRLPNETTTTKYLRQDGTWAIPPNTTYAAATQSSNGLMSSSDKKKLDGLSASGGTRRTLVTLPASTEASKVFTLSGKDICKGLKLYFYYHSSTSQGGSSSTLVKTVLLTQSALTNNAISINGKDVTLSSSNYTNIVKGYVDTTTTFTLTCKCVDINNAPLYKLNNVSFSFGFGSPSSVSFSIEAVDL